MQKSQILDLVDATWPAKDITEAGAFRQRRAEGAGKRVSCADLHGRFCANEFEGFIAEFRPQVFVLFPEDHALDAALAARGWDRVDPLLVYRARIDDVLATETGQNGVQCGAIAHWPPLAITSALWAEGGTGAARLEVMARVQGAKAAVLGRCGEAAAGVGFVACAGPEAMLHALFVQPHARKKGLGRTLVIAAARAAKDFGATRLSLVVLEDNRAAIRLYEAMGFHASARYHYRMAP